MAININGNNYSIAVDGNLTIEHVNFGFGGGIQSASGIHQEEPIDCEAIEVKAGDCKTVSAEEQSVPTMDGRKKTYPEITEQNKGFFAKTFWVTQEINGSMGRKIQDIPTTWILHTIYDTTTNWNPSDTSSVHKWKILYEVLRRQRYFRIETKQRYAEYVKAVVKYCFPDTKDGYANNLSKSKLDEHIGNWTAPDKQLYQQLKATLTIP